MVNFFRFVGVVVKLLPSDINIQTQTDKFHIKVACTLEEVCRLTEVCFEYVCDTDDARILRKREFTP